MQRPPRAPPDGAAIAAGFVVLCLFLACTGAGYYFLVYEAQFTCERARDSCEVVEVNRFRREVTHRFQPSRVAEARLERLKRKSCAVVTLKGDESAVWICHQVDEVYVGRLNDFVADPRRDRLDYRIAPSIIEFAILGVIACFTVVPLFGAAHRTIRRSLSP